MNPSNPVPPTPVSTALPTPAEMKDALEEMHSQLEHSQHTQKEINQKLERSEQAQEQIFQQFEEEIKNLQQQMTASLLQITQAFVTSEPLLALVAPNAFAVSAIPEPQPARRPKPRLPDIHLFSGKGSEYQVWSQTAEANVEQDGDAIGNDSNQFTYLWMRISTAAQTKVSPLYRQAKSKNHTAAQFLKALDAIFLDPHAEERAEAELYRLSQGNNEPFSVFMPKFENLLLEAGIVGDRACISILKRCLNDELIRAVCTGVKAKTYPAFVSEVFGLASDLEALRGRQTQMNTHPRFGHWTPAPAPPTQAAPSPDKMDWQPSNVPLKPITPGERESLKQSNSCFRCRKPGHVRRNCPLNQGQPVVTRAMEPQQPDNTSVPPMPEGETIAKEEKGATGTYIDVTLNKNILTAAFVDSGCLCLATISPRTVLRCKATTLPIVPRPVEQVIGDPNPPIITQIAVINLGLGGHDEKLYAYIVPDQTEDLILGQRWLTDHDASVRPSQNEVILRKPFRLCLTTTPLDPDTTAISQCTVRAFRAQVTKTKGVRVFSASLHDIEKALQTKIYTDPRTSCPSWLLPVISAFDRKKAATLPPSRPGLDTEIRLKPDESTPACPLYSMSREELLALRQTLYELLDSGFIRASSAEGGAPVIFVKKPSGGIRFCIDYRALNNATEKDGYPLPLIHDTLRDIASAKYVSKVDVISAFHRLRVKEGHESRTVFRTHLGSFEWLVTPFGLSGAPASFQRSSCSLM
ncbi:Retrotransposable element Tf2 155 kDa protein type 1 [Ceratocystis lukuohia]|uniref:Retrotransposable element Tf2 155 kDa protein type 1 n=1 Tax=Ceratocystis lukuohia TaxID=2019550 RepID=A0ABR4MAI4_9PEZI